MRALALVATLFLATAAQALPLEERDWIQMTSSNFRVQSVSGEDRTRELLRHLEVMHSAFGNGQPTAGVDSGNPTTILILDNHDDYVAVGAPPNSMGYFIAGLRENAIIVEDSSEKQGIEVILHEYVHYLSLQKGRVRYPRWFEEGRAEYLSGSRLEDDMLVYGLPLKRRTVALSFGAWLPLRTVLQLTDLQSLSNDEIELFYGQSWLLVHYLSSQPDADMTLPVSTRRYSDLVGRGTDRIAAFEEAFSQDVDELESTLLKYFMDGALTVRRIPADTRLEGFSPTVRRMAIPEVQLSLARMALRFEDLDRAELWFRGVLGDPEYRAHGEAGLGRILGVRGDIEGAQERFDNAIYLMAWDFDIWMDFAQFWAQRVSVTLDPLTRRRYALRLMESLESALTIREATPELNSLMGFAYLAMNRDVAEAITYLEAAAEAAPYDQASRLLLANAYLRLGDSARAVSMAEAILSLEHEPSEVSHAAKALIARAQEQAN